MKQILLSSVLALATGLATAACTKSPVAFDARTCALLSACTEGDVGTLCRNLQNLAVESGSAADPHRVGEPARVTVLLRCLNDATTCAAIAACSVPTPAETALCDGSEAARCSGSVIVQCNGASAPTVVDCAASGLTCVEGSQILTCGAAACEPGATKPSCQGDALVACEGSGTTGVLTSTSCKDQMGVTCDDLTGACHVLLSETCGVVNGAAQCVGSGAACDPGSAAVACDGSVIVGCRGGRVAEYDCARQGLSLTCKTLRNGLAACVGAGADCDDTTPESCDDGVITFCMWGSTTTLDCGSYGLSGCATTKGQRTTAHCLQQ
jgi:hypothetical protein